MDNITVEEYFDLFVTHTKKNRAANNNMDGQKYWQTFKVIFEKSDWQASKWKKLPKKDGHAAMSLPESMTNGYGEVKMIEINHFVIQCYRIPSTEEPSLRKIMQLALNIGQFMGMKKPRGLMAPPKTADTYLLKKDLSVKLEDICDKESLIKLLHLLD
jgi:hypothetical protein